MNQPVIDTCDRGHAFAKFEDHPKRDGIPRCPYCMAEGINLLKVQLMLYHNALKEISEMTDTWAEFHAAETARETLDFKGITHAVD